MALQEVPAVAKGSLLSQTTIDISQRKTKHKYLQLFMCWIQNLPASEKQTSDVKKSKAVVPSVCDGTARPSLLVCIPKGCLERSISLQSERFYI